MKGGFAVTPKQTGKEGHFSFTTKLVVVGQTDVRLRTTSSRK